MPKKFKIAPEVKQQILDRIKQGGLVSEIATEHGISTKTVYNWLSKGATAPPSWTVYNRLKKEKQALLALIGELTLKVSAAEKKGAHS